MELPWRIRVSTNQRAGRNKLFACPAAISMTGNNELQIWIENHKFSSATNDSSVLFLRTGQCASGICLLIDNIYKINKIMPISKLM